MGHYSVPKVGRTRYLDGDSVRELRCCGYMLELLLAAMRAEKGLGRGGATVRIASLLLSFLT
jgi:hypothetical protein